MTFGECLLAASRSPELVAEFDRLAGTRLSALDARRPIDAAIDEATGRERDEALMFAAFVYEVIFLRLISPAE